LSKTQILTCPVGILQTNCYLLINNQTREAVIIDPGAESLKIQKTCRELNLTPVAILLTHGHFDHFIAADKIRQAYSIPVCIGEMEKELLADAVMNGSRMIRALDAALSADSFFTDDERLDIAGLSIRVIHSPGHTPGGACFYLEDENILISGDTLFRDSFGRTDMPGGDIGALAATIINQLFTLPGTTVVYPGHGEKTTVEYEKQRNMILTFIK
jgi:glyoxylase-like metal-dependent hydrolase (beta-lactamase superfamily II)